MNAGEIIDQLLRTRWLSGFCIPNFAPLAWWENDVFEITRAGYWHEMEVKTSRSDFFKDRDKERRMGKLLGVCKKWDLMNRGHLGGPSRFTYVVPEDLITPEDLPPFAGLTYAVRARGNIRFRIVRRAPKIHGEKVTSVVRRDAEAVCYYRWHRDRSTPRDAKESDGSGI